jgi:hypothetical protein
VDRDVDVFARGEEQVSVVVSFRLPCKKSGLTKTGSGIDQAVRPSTPPPLADLQGVALSGLCALQPQCSWRIVNTEIRVESERGHYCHQRGCLTAE